MVQLAGTPAVAASADGRLEVFATGADGALYRRGQQSFDDDDSWAPWYSHGSPPLAQVLGSPAVSPPYWPVPVIPIPLPWPRVLALRVVGSNNSVYEIRQTAENGGWTGWVRESDPRDSGIPVVLSPELEVGGALKTQGGGIPAEQETSLRIFAVGADRAVYHLDSAAAAWRAFGGSFAAAPALGTDPAGRMYLFAVGTDGNLYHKWETGPPQPAGESWTGDWLSHNSPAGVALTGRPAVSPTQLRQIFVVGADGALYRRAEAGGGWADWSAEGSPAGVPLRESPAVLVRADGRLQAFAVAADGMLYHKLQAVPAGAWSDWASDGSPVGVALAGRPVVGWHFRSPLMEDLRHAVFVMGNDGAVYYKWETGPAGGWADWSTLGQP
jgi:hypothetical protein